MVESRTTNIFRAEFDEEGVYVYQAFRDSIADYALAHGRFGGPDFNPARMTWIKPSFAWMLYHCGCGHRDQNQKRILKIKVPHEVMADILRECSCQHGGGGSVGRVQWDPERDLWHAERVTSRKGVNVETAGCLPDTAEADTTRKLIVQPAKIGTIAEDVRSIQIGISKELSQRYCTNVLEILDMNDLAHAVGAAHNLTRDEEVTAAPRLAVADRKGVRAACQRCGSDQAQTKNGARQGDRSPTGALSQQEFRTQLGGRAPAVSSIPCKVRLISPSHLHHSSRVATASRKSDNFNTVFRSHLRKQ